MDTTERWGERLVFLLWQEQCMMCEKLLSELAKTLSKAKLGPVTKLLFSKLHLCWPNQIKKKYTWDMLLYLKWTKLIIADNILEF